MYCNAGHKMLFRKINLLENDVGSGFKLNLDDAGLYLNKKVLLWCISTSISIYIDVHACKRMYMIDFMYIHVHTCTCMYMHVHACTCLVRLPILQ